MKMFEISAAVDWLEVHLGTVWPLKYDKTSSTKSKNINLWHFFLISRPVLAV